MRGALTAEDIQRVIEQVENTPGWTPPPIILNSAQYDRAAEMNEAGKIPNGNVLAADRETLLYIYYGIKSKEVAT